jgi:hypothetical protein
MIVGAALAAWLSDRQRQQRAHASVEALARDWKQHPLMTGLERTLSSLPERSTAALLDAARGFMDREDDVADLIGALIAASRRDPFSRPPFQTVKSAIHDGLLLFHDPDLSIVLSVCGVDMLAAKKAGSRGATSISFSGVTSLFRYLKAGGATLSFWEAPPITDDFVASRAGQCRLVGRRRIEDGEEILVDGRYQSFIVEHATSDLLYFNTLIRAGAAPLGVEYDSRTLSFVGATSTDEASSRLQMMVSMLRTMERDDAFALIEESLASPHFYTRWHVMRELLAMNAEAALPALRRMAANDPHPEVRVAAQQSLELFFEDESADQGEMKCRA